MKTNILLECRRSRGKMAIKQIPVVVAWGLFAVTIVLSTGGDRASAASEVNCASVMNELNNGKDADDVARDLSISTSSVDECIRASKAVADTNAANKTPQPQASPILRGGDMDGGKYGGETGESAGGCPQEPCPPDAPKQP
jgi:hypothetical protein